MNFNFLWLLNVRGANLRQILFLNIKLSKTGLRFHMSNDTANLDLDKLTRYYYETELIL
jgi:hypothetical protein